MFIPFLSFIEPLSLFLAYLLIVAFLLVVFALYDRSYKSYVFKNLYVSCFCNDWCVVSRFVYDACTDCLPTLEGALHG
jgi:hypothetical protein